MSAIRITRRTPKTIKNHHTLKIFQKATFGMVLDFAEIYAHFWPFLISKIAFGDFWWKKPDSTKVFSAKRAFAGTVSGNFLKFHRKFPVEGRKFPGRALLGQFRHSATALWRNILPAKGIFKNFWKFPLFYFLPSKACFCYAKTCFWLGGERSFQKWPFLKLSTQGSKMGQRVGCLLPLNAKLLRNLAF